MLLSRNKMAVSSLVAVLFIAGCEDSSNAFSYPQTETGLELTPFAHELVQGQTLTVDFATHVAGDDDWTLIDVVDPNGLVSIVEQGPTFVKI
ncbi:hypothetical protein AB4298_21315, partial [Shewanella sp. 10N.261.52.F9]|uniref:hypothetical protein n=1 Tax=Shewanella sp. 10N.261.52.F9 TaxID=3229684 RepID=UPI0035505276